MSRPEVGQKQSIRGTAGLSKVVGRQRQEVRQRDRETWRALCALPEFGLYPAGRGLNVGLGKWRCRDSKPYGYLVWRLI